MTARMTTAREGAAVVMRFEGDLTLGSIAPLWRPALDAARLPAGNRLTIELAAVPACDTAGATLLAVLEQQAGGADIRNAHPDVEALLTRVRAARAIKAVPPAPRGGNPLRAALTSALDGIAFLGEVVVATVRAPSRRRMIPARDLLAYTDAAGVNAIPLVALLGFLMGLILAFQSSIPLRRFGAEIFIVNLVVISLFRELGPLLAAVILAGRTGSAFAAELGTMVVNEEVAAIATMGIDPVTMLVLPRLAATMLVMPGLSLLLDLAGLIGMTLVMGVLGYPPIAVYNQLLAAASLRDLVGGLVKSLVFGAAVAVIGCRTGLGAGLGPRAVGQAATAAVVGSIFATIVLDGIFTVLYYRLDI